MAKSTFEFTEAGVYYPVAAMSIRENSAGLASLSRKSPHVFAPTDAFKFVAKENGTPFVTPLTGLHAGAKLATHRNHFDANDGYNTTRQSGGSVDDRIAMTELRLDQAARTLQEQEELLQKLMVEKEEQAKQKAAAELKAAELKAEAELMAEMKKEEQEAAIAVATKAAEEEAEEITTGPSDEEASAIAEANEAIEEEGGIETEDEDDDVDSDEDYADDDDFEATA